MDKVTLKIDDVSKDVNNLINKLSGLGEFAKTVTQALIDLQKQINSIEHRLGDYDCE